MENLDLNFNFLYEDYNRAIYTFNKDEESLKIKKKKILNQSNNIYNAVIINLCLDLKNKLDNIKITYFPDENTTPNSNNVIEYIVTIISRKPSNIKNVLYNELKEFYNALEELNMMLISKFNFSLLTILNSIVESLKINDSVIYLDRNNNSVIPGIITQISNTQKEIKYTIKPIKKFSDKIFEQVERGSIMPDIISFFVKDRIRYQYALIKYIVNLMVGYQAGYEIKIYLTHILISENLLSRKFILNDNNYQTLNQPVSVWRDNETFQKFKHLEKIKNINDLKEIFINLQQEKVLLNNTSIDICHEKPLCAPNLLMIFNYKRIIENLTMYIKIIDKNDRSIYWIQISDIQFFVTKDTFLYTCDKVIKKTLLRAGDAFVVNFQDTKTKNSIIIPNNSNNTLLFINKISLVSDYYISKDVKVFPKYGPGKTKEGVIRYYDKSNGFYWVKFTEGDDSWSTPSTVYDPEIGAEVKTEEIDHFSEIFSDFPENPITNRDAREQFRISLRKFKREDLDYKDYSKTSGYLNLEDTNFYLLTENTLNGLFLKYLDNSIIENLLFLKNPVVKLTSIEQKQLQVYENKIKKRNSSNNYLNSFLSFFKSSQIDPKMGPIFNKEYSIDLDEYSQLCKKKNLGQNLEELIYQSLKYDFDFKNTLILLDSINNCYENHNFHIYEFGYQILRCFLDFSRINQSNKLSVIILFSNLTAKIVSPLQISQFVIELLSMYNLDSFKIKICQEYIKEISNNNYFDIQLVDKYYDSLNDELKNFIIEYNKYKYTSLEPLMSYLKIPIPENEEEYEKLKVLNDCTVYDNNFKKKYKIIKDEIIFKRPDSYPFLSYEKGNKLLPKKLLVSVIKKQNKTLITFNIPRNNIEYCF